MSNLLADFFEEEFLTVQDLTPRRTKQFRNAIARASMMLEHPIEYIDVVGGGFRSLFLEELLKVGFTVNRAEDFVACIRKVTEAMREAKCAKPRPAPNFLEQGLAWIADHRRSIALLFDDDQICSSSYHNAMECHEHGEALS